MNKMTVIAALATLASAGMLHAQSAQSGQQPQQPRQHAEDGRGPGGRRGGGMDNMLLKGITLSDAQKAKLQELHQAERAKMQANGQRGERGQNPEFQAIREARQKGDTATANRLMQEARAKMEARRDEQVKAIRALLTPDQAKQLDANVAAMKQHEGQFRGRGFGGHGADHQGATRPGTNGR